jgi:hypothetical protein
MKLPGRVVIDADRLGTHRPVDGAGGWGVAPKHRPYWIDFRAVGAVHPFDSIGGALVPARRDRGPAPDVPEGAPCSAHPVSAWRFGRAAAADTAICGSTMRDGATTAGWDAVLPHGGCRRWRRPASVRARRADQEGRLSNSVIRVTPPSVLAAGPPLRGAAACRRPLQMPWRSGSLHGVFSWDCC